jgi:hypothetical protein
VHTDSVLAPEDQTSGPLEHCRSRSVLPVTIEVQTWYEPWLARYYCHTYV